MLSKLYSQRRVQAVLLDVPHLLLEYPRSTPSISDMPSTRISMHERLNITGGGRNLEPLSMGDTVVAAIAAS